MFEGAVMHRGPTQLGSYKLVRLLGEGSFGKVYEGHDSVLRRRVAVKTLRPELNNNRRFIERFVTEARVLAGLIHQNITTLYGLHCDDSIYYMAIEFVDGLTLEGLQGECGAISVDAARSIAAQVIAGLGHAHTFTDEEGKTHPIVHRDIKPANVMVAKNGRCKIMDFGIARVGRGIGTTTGIGTLVYAPPEQLDPKILKAGSIDFRADMYGLAATLYELVSGQPPFPLPYDDEEAERLKEMKVATLPPDLAELIGAEGADVGFCAAVMRALAVSRNDRFPDLRSFETDLGITDAHRDPVRLTNIQKLAAPSGQAPSTAQQAVRPVDDPKPNGDFYYHRVGDYGRKVTYAENAVRQLVVALRSLHGSAAASSRKLILLAGAAALIGAVAVVAVSTMVREDRPIALQNDMEAAAWKRAMDDGRLEAYAEYLDRFPSDTHSGQARNTIANLDDEAWRKAEGAGVAAAYKAYLDQPRFQQHRQAAIRAHAVTAHRDAEQAAWDRATSDGRAEAYAHYLDIFKDENSNHTAAALQAIREADVERQAWNAAMTSGEPAQIRQYINDYGDRIPDHARQARRKLAELTAQPPPPAGSKSEVEAKDREREGQRMAARISGAVSSVFAGTDMITVGGRRIHILGMLLNSDVNDSLGAMINEASRSNLVCIEDGVYKGYFSCGYARNGRQHDLANVLILKKIASASTADRQNASNQLDDILRGLGK